MWDVMCHWLYRNAAACVRGERIGAGEALERDGLMPPNCESFVCVLRRINYCRSLEFHAMQQGARRRRRQHFCSSKGNYSHYFRYHRIDSSFFSASSRRLIFGFVPADNNGDKWFSAWWKRQPNSLITTEAESLLVPIIRATKNRIKLNWAHLSHSSRCFYSTKEGNISQNHNEKPLNSRIAIKNETHD